MGEDRDLLERVSTLEEQFRGISEMKGKIDTLYNLLMEMKLDGARNKAEVALKADCIVCRKEVDEEIEELKAGRQKLFWAVLSSGSVLVIWLVEQLLHLTIQIG